MSRRAISGNFFSRRKSRKCIWVLKSGHFGLKFRHSLETSIHHYKMINLRNWKDFSWENFYFVFFLFRLQAWNFVFLSAIGSRLSKPAPKNNPRRTFFGQEKKKKLAFEWQFSVFSAEPFVGVCQNTAFNTTKWTICGKKILRRFLLCIFVFRLGGQSLVHLGQNRSRLSNRVPKTSPIKRFLWIRTQEEEIGNWAHFSRTVGQKFRRGYQNCNLNVHRSIYRYYLFLSVFSVFEMFLNLERKSCHTWRFFFCIFLKIVCEVRGPFWGEVFFPKKVLYFF